MDNSLNNQNPAVVNVNPDPSISTPQTTIPDQVIPQQTLLQSQPFQQNVVDPLLSTRVDPEDLDMKWTRWKCLVCGYLYEGIRPLKKCPRCGNEEPDKFQDAD